MLCGGLHRRVCIILIGAEAEIKAQRAAQLKADSTIIESERWATVSGREKMERGVVNGFSAYNAILSIATDIHQPVTRRDRRWDEAIPTFQLMEGYALSRGGMRYQLEGILYHTGAFNSRIGHLKDRRVPQSGGRWVRRWSG